MTAKIIQIAVSAAGSFDGATDFSLSSGLTPVNGVITETFTAGIGRLARESLSPYVGNAGFYIRDCWYDLEAAAITNAFIALVQPGAPTTYSAGSVFFANRVYDGDAFPSGALGAFQRQYYVPPGWDLLFAALDGSEGAPVAGPYSASIVIDSAPDVIASIRTHKTLWWPRPDRHDVTPA